MTIQQKLDNWLDILNDISVYIEQFIMNEEDKDRIHKLDKVIDQIYELLEYMKKNNIGGDNE
jgi:ribosomal protein S15P/S13E